MSSSAPRHGTYLGYSSDGCRCDLCRQAKAAYVRQRRADNAAADPNPWRPVASSCAAFLNAYADGPTAAPTLRTRAADIRAAIDDLTESADAQQETP